MSAPSTIARLKSVPLHAVAALMAAVGMLALGAVRIGRSFGYDEGYTYAFFIDGGSVRRALTTQVVFNNHPMFSAIQATAWRLGFTGETSQRFLPLLCAAVTVGVVVWYVSRRSGLTGGAAAGAILALNPLFFDAARQLRGYSLATMAVVVAAVAVRHSWNDERRRWLVLQGACMVVAVTTHAYSAVTILMLAVAALVLGRIERRHLITWGASAVTALLIMAPVLDDARRNSAARGSRYNDWFFRTLVESLTGRERVAMVLTIVALAVGAVEVGRRSRRHAAALCASFGVLAVVVLVLWQVVRPLDLYPRFFVSVVPFIAVLAGIGLARVPRPAGAAVAVALVVVLAPPALDLLDRESGIRDAAAATDVARSLDLGVCGFHAEPLWAYTDPMPMISAMNGFNGCDVFVSVLTLSAEQRENATAWYSGSVGLGGGTIVWADQQVLDQILLD